MPFNPRPNRLKCCACVLLQFAVQYEHRASVKLERMDVINSFVDNIPTVRPLMTVPPSPWHSIVLHFGAIMHSFLISLYSTRDRTLEETLTPAEILIPTSPLCPLQPPYKVDLEKPDKTLIVQLIKSCAAVSVVSNYWQLQKYNIRELCMSDEERAAKEVAKDEDRKKQQVLYLLKNNKLMVQTCPDQAIRESIEKRLQRPYI